MADQSVFEGQSTLPELRSFRTLKGTESLNRDPKKQVSLDNTHQMDCKVLSKSKWRRRAREVGSTPCSEYARSGSQSRMKRHQGARFRRCLQHPTSTVGSSAMAILPPHPPASDGILYAGDCYGSATGIRIRQTIGVAIAIGAEEEGTPRIARCEHASA